MVVLMCPGAWVHSGMFQIIKISFRNPLTGEEKKDVHFMGPAAFSKEEFDQLKSKTLGELITAISIGEPEDPMKYAHTDPEIKDLMDSFADLGQEYEDKKIG